MKLPYLFFVLITTSLAFACDSAGNKAGAGKKDVAASATDTGVNNSDIIADSGAIDSASSPAADTSSVLDISSADTAIVPADSNGKGGQDTQSSAVDAGVAKNDTGGATPQPDAGAPQSVDAGTASYTLPAGLNGKIVEGAPALAQFSGVKDSQNKLVTKDIFLGHWTVLWFYPFASTPG